VNNVADGSSILLDVDFFAFTVSASPAMGPASRTTSMAGLGIEIVLL
jgi:hypothetical protein